MPLTRIEMDVMQAQERFLQRDVPELLAQMKRQADATERVALQFEQLMQFLHGTTIEQVEEKRKEMRNKNRSKKATKSVETLKKFNGDQ